MNRLFPPPLPVRGAPPDVAWVAVDPRHEASARRKSLALARIAEHENRNLALALEPFAVSDEMLHLARWNLLDYEFQISELGEQPASDMPFTHALQGWERRRPPIDAELADCLKPLLQGDSKIAIWGPSGTELVTAEQLHFRIELPSPALSRGPNDGPRRHRQWLYEVACLSGTATGLETVAGILRSPRFERRSHCWVVINVAFGYEVLGGRDSMMAAYCHLFHPDLSGGDGATTWLGWGEGVVGVAGREGVLLLRNINTLHDEPPDSAEPTHRFRSCVPSTSHVFTAAKFPVSGQRGAIEGDVLWGGIVWWLWIFANYQRRAIDHVARKAAELVDGYNSIQASAAARDLFETVLYLENQWMYDSLATSSDANAAYRSLSESVEVSKAWADVQEQIRLVSSWQDRLSDEYIALLNQHRTRFGFFFGAAVLWTGLMGMNITQLQQRDLWSTGPLIVLGVVIGISFSLYFYFEAMARRDPVRKTVAVVVFLFTVIIGAFAIPE